MTVVDTAVTPMYPFVKARSNVELTKRQKDTPPCDSLLAAPIAGASLSRSLAGETEYRATVTEVTHEQGPSGVFDYVVTYQRQATPDADVIVTFPPKPDGLPTVDDIPDPDTLR